MKRVWGKFEQIICLTGTCHSNPPGATQLKQLLSKIDSTKGIGQVITGRWESHQSSSGGSWASLVCWGSFEFDKSGVSGGAPGVSGITV